MSAEDEKEETFEEKPVKFAITSSLEGCKSKFFTGDITGFINDVTNCKFQVYSANYKFSDDYEGRPMFVINNLLRGFAKQLEEMRKYLFVVFRCTKIGEKYSITSTWICNCIVGIEQVIPDKYEDFEWNSIKVNETTIQAICDSFVKKDEWQAVAYLH